MTPSYIGDNAFGILEWEAPEMIRYKWVTARINEVYQKSHGLGWMFQVINDVGNII
jgi:hypothetical protein